MTIDALAELTALAGSPRPPRGGTIHRYAGGCADFLLAFATGTTGLTVLNYVLRHHADPLFTAFPDRG
ncbi:hypothetical protein Daura_24440 [Dactylosporangium aurantiacum]|uniref:Uncharacterized protein n=1 Tax=Dactylosporangium aurantiacum TaxID=35754 RepID=A0A9Q9INP7_9ACTN|nr:hypothetical protein [Dactylosporangium aurantiacum]MDG6103756.1 hypothetical protein [Dactylosporangium aurantiacum]UWZ59031.1 hypothetical protein Daura_24440 [Dactylosporangium aurantiacum]